MNKVETVVRSFPGLDDQAANWQERHALGNISLDRFLRPRSIIIPI